MTARSAETAAALRALRPRDGDPPPPVPDEWQRLLDDLARLDPRRRD